MRLNVLDRGQPGRGLLAQGRTAERHQRGDPGQVGERAQMIRSRKADSHANRIGVAERRRRQQLQAVPDRIALGGPVGRVALQQPADLGDLDGLVHRDVAHPGAAVGQELHQAARRELLQGGPRDEPRGAEALAQVGLDQPLIRRVFAAHDRRADGLDDGELGVAWHLARPLALFPGRTTQGEHRPLLVLTKMSATHPTPAGARRRSAAPWAGSRWRGTPRWRWPRPSRPARSLRRP